MDNFCIGTVTFCNQGYIFRSYIKCDILLRYSRITLRVYTHTDIVDIPISSYNDSQYDAMFMNTMHFVLEGLRSGLPNKYTICELLDSIIIKDTYTKLLHTKIYSHIPYHCKVIRFDANAEYKHIKYNNNILSEKMYKRLYIRSA